MKIIIILIQISTSILFSIPLSLDYTTGIIAEPITHQFGTKTLIIQKYDYNSDNTKKLSFFSEKAIYNYDENGDIKTFEYFSGFTKLKECNYQTNLYGKIEVAKCYDSEGALDKKYEYYYNDNNKISQKKLMNFSTNKTEYFKYKYTNNLLTAILSYDEKGLSSGNHKSLWEYDNLDGKVVEFRWTINRAYSTGPFITKRYKYNKKDLLKKIEGVGDSYAPTSEMEIIYDENNRIIERYYTSYNFAFMEPPYEISKKIYYQYTYK